MNVDSQLCDQLHVINTVFRNPIDTYESDDQYKTLMDHAMNQPLLKTPLLNHQAHMVASMFLYKDRMTNGYQYHNQSMRGKVGIVADPPGSGKTLTMLAYIAATQAAEQTLSGLTQRLGELNTQSTRYFFSHSVEPGRVTDMSETSVIVVSPYVLQQWCQETEQHTHLRPFVIDNRRALRNRSSPAALVASHFVLTTTRLYKDVSEFLTQHGIRVKHMFLDDAASIFLGTNDPMLPHTSFLWLITSRWWCFLFKNIYLNPFHLNHVRDAITPPLTQECESWLQEAMDANAQIHANVESSGFFRTMIPYHHDERGLLVLRNSKGRIPIRPTLTNTALECYSKLTLASMPMSIIGNNYEGLVHERIPKLFRALDVTARTTEEVVAHHKEREQLIRCTQDNECCICLDVPQNRVMLSCCMNVFCGACVLRQLMTHPQCPTCRSLLYLPNFLYIPKDEDTAASTMPPMNRQEACIHYIKQNPDKHYVIYSPFENSYYQMYPVLEQAGILCDRLDGNIGRFHRSIVNFNKGTSKVLFVSCADLLQGITLLKATHLIFFYDLPFFEQRQTLVNSALRQGRLEPLTLVHLTSNLDG